MGTRQIRIGLENWYPANYTQIPAHGQELELYLWIDGRDAYRLFDYGQSDVLPPAAASGGASSPWDSQMLDRKFKVRLVAIERDGWPDGQGDAGGEITIDLDKAPPDGTWQIVAGSGGSPPVEITFTVEYLSCVVSSSPGPGHASDSQPGFPFPWGRDALVFEHWLGLGRSSPIRADPARKYHEQVWFIVPLDGPGRRGKQVITTYRYGAAAIGLDHGRMSSVYIPRNAQMVLYEFDFGHPRFAAGKSLRLGHAGLHNLNQTRWDDRVAAIELITTQFVAAAARSPN